MRLKTLLALFTACVLLACSTLSLARSPFDIAEHTPGYQHNREGQRAWNNGNYFDARHRFERAAWWADKLGQYNLGVIHYRGDGVERDPARGWAWFKLSAERGYPDFIATAEAVWAELDEVQQKRAEALLEELKPRYGDAVAVPRTAEHMRRERRQVTGSRTGHVGSIRVIDRSGRSRDGSEYFAAEKWDFYQIVQLETQLFDAIARGRVELGEFEIIDDSDEPTSDDANEPAQEPTP